LLSLENKFAIGSSDKNVAICYYETEQRFWAAEMIKKKPKSTVTCIAWHPNNQLIAVGSCDYRCRFVWEMIISKMNFFHLLESIRLILKQLMEKFKNQLGVTLHVQENFYKNSHLVC
jgi:WD40 repeat protein